MWTPRPSIRAAPRLTLVDRTGQPNRCGRSLSSAGILRPQSRDRGWRSVPALPRPDLPPGAHRDLVDALHDLHHRAGWPSLRTLANAAGCSHTTVSAVFSSARLPPWGVLELLVESMDGNVEEFHDLWLAASTPEHRAAPHDRRHRRPPHRAGRSTPPPRVRRRAPARHRRGRHRQDDPGARLPPPAPTRSSRPEPACRCRPRSRSCRSPRR